MAKPSTYRPGEQRPFNLVLSPEQNLDLHAFCELHYNVSQTGIIRRAIEELIARETEDAETRERFEAIRDRLTDSSIRILPTRTHAPHRSAKRAMGSR